MMKHAMATLGLALLASLAHADGDYVESDRRSGPGVPGRHESVLDDHPAGRHQHGGTGHRRPGGRSIRFGFLGLRAQISGHGPRRRTQPPLPRLLHARPHRQHARRRADRVPRRGAPAGRSAAGANSICACSPSPTAIRSGMARNSSSRRRSGSPRCEIAAQAKVATEAVHINQTEDEAGPFPTPGIATRPGCWASTSISTAACNT